MAISLEGTVTGSAGTGNEAGPLVLQIPDPHQANDIFLVFATAMDGTNLQDITANAEYSEETSGFPVTSTAGTDVNIHCFYRVLTSASDTDISLTPAASARLASVGFLLRGVDTGNPFDVAPTIDTRGNAALTAACPAITPNNPNGALILVLQSASGSGTRMTSVGVPATPSGLLEGASYYPGDRNYQDIATAYKLDYGAAVEITPSVWSNEYADAKINPQDQTSYDGVGDNGTFVGGDGAGGTSHAISDVITLDSGATVTVNSVDGNGDVVTFNSNLGADTGGHTSGETLTQTGSTGTGTGFSLTLGWENIEGNANEVALASVVLRPESGATSIPYVVPEPQRIYRKSGRFL